jgi:hypothetical protein
MLCKFVYGILQFSTSTVSIHITADTGTPRLTNRIPSEHLVVSLKYEMSWNIHPQAGRGHTCK